LHDGSGGWTDVPLEDPGKGHESRAMDHRAPDQCNKTRIGLEHPKNLAGGLTPVGKVLKAQLTESDVKKSRRKG
jgi:hypothetical protein